MPILSAAPGALLGMGRRLEALMTRSFLPQAFEKAAAGSFLQNKSLDFLPDPVLTSDTAPAPAEDRPVFQPQLRLHDRYQLELKLDVDFPRRQRKQRYKVEAYLFLPRSLGLNDRTYSSKDFYSDIQTYLRFKTPTLTLAQLTERREPGSPLRRLEGVLNKIRAGDRSEKAAEEGVAEIKLLGNVIRSQVRDHAGSLLREARRLSKSDGVQSAHWASWETRSAEFLTDLKATLRAIRSLRSLFRDKTLPMKFRKAYFRLDEFISLTVESRLSILLAGLAPLRPEGEIEAALRRATLAEQGHRTAAGYPSLLSPDSDNETFGLRRSQLKRYISSLLFLDLRISERNTARELIFSVAAGAAMLFSVLAMVIVQSRFAFNSLVFITVAVVSYMLKDRIKDWLKVFFTDHMASWLSDHSGKIFELSPERMIGRFREALRFVPESSVPLPVHEARRRLGGPADENGVVLKYAKSVSVNGKRISGRQQRVENSVNEILRLSVSSFLKKMDDPQHREPYLNPKTGELERAVVARTYPVDVVFRFILPATGQEQVEAVRLYLTRNGIKRARTASVQARPK